MAKGKKTGGRVKGSINKQSASVKQCIINAFEDIGGVKNLAAWASENQTEFYKLWGRMIPHEVTGAGGDDIKITVKKIVHNAGNND